MSWEKSFVLVDEAPTGHRVLGTGSEGGQGSGAVGGTEGGVERSALGNPGGKTARKSISGADCIDWKDREDGNLVECSLPRKRERRIAAPGDDERVGS